MLTEWAPSIGDVALNDYPRPQLQRDQWQNLNGPWQYAITARSAREPSAWDGAIQVPFCVESALSGVQRSVDPEQRLWYRRTFGLEKTDQRTLLNFGAVDYECTLWINGGLVGSHVGGFDPFTMDISAFVKPGDNEITLAVTDPSSSADQPRGKQHLKPNGIWYTPVTGIWQTVWLELVPMQQHIEELKVTPAPDCNAIDVIAFIHRPSRDPQLAIRIVASLNGAEVAQTTARPDRRVRLRIPDPVLWSPESPSLYDLKVSLIRIADPLPQIEDGQTLKRTTPLRGKIEADLYAQADTSQNEIIDSVTSYFGLRRIELGKHPHSGQPTLLLNGDPVFHLGPLDQGWWPDGLHTPPSDEAMIYEITYLKEAGFNTLRKHIKIEPARYYYHCDRLGILVWQDMPSGFLPGQFVAPNDQEEGLRGMRATETFDLELHRMINHLAHHPSIVIWVLHNEGWGQFDTHRLTQLIKSLDPHRLVNASSGWLDVGAGDLIDKHDYEPEPTPPESDGKRALVIGEYGGVGWPVDGHQWNPEMRNWGYQTFHSEEEVKTAYLAVTNAIIAMQQEHGLCGAIYTQTTDVEGEVNGLLTYDRKIEKLPRQWLRAVHGPLTAPDRDANNETGS